MVYDLFRALSGDRAFCHRPRATRSVVASSRQRRGAKTTRLRRPQHDAFVSCITRVHRIPRPTLVTIREAPLFIGHGTREEVPVICPSSQATCLRQVGTPGKSPGARKTLSSDKQLLEVSRHGCGARRRVPWPRSWGPMEAVVRGLDPRTHPLEKIIFLSR